MYNIYLNLKVVEDGIEVVNEDSIDAKSDEEHFVSEVFYERYIYSKFHVYIAYDLFL